MATPIMSNERLRLQQDYINSKVHSSKQFDKYGLTLVDSNDIIINSLMGELRNIVLTFFKGKLYTIKKCEHCGSETAAQYERAHDKGFSRYDVALSALNKIRPDGVANIKQKDFMKAFIEEHANVPLWLLCKVCHVKYDKGTTD